MLKYCNFWFLSVYLQYNLLERGSFNAPIIMLFVTGINIFINYILIPKIGILGSALASFFSNSLAIISYKISQNILKYKFPYKEFQKF